MIPKIIQQITCWPIYLVLKIFFRYQVEGQENLRGLEDGPVIFASNHASYLDGPISAIAVISKEGLIPSKILPIRFLVAKEYYYFKTNPFPFPLNLFTTLYVRLNGSIPVIRGSGDLQASLAKPIKLLKEQKIKLWIYPEGKITKDGKLQQGKRGIAYLHQQTGAPIVPVGISGNYRILYPRELLKFLFGSKKLKVKIGKPIYSLGSVSLEEGVERVMKEIEKLIEF